MPHEASRFDHGLLEVLCCPRDASTLVECGGAPGDHPENGVRCTHCGRLYPARNGLLRFVEGDHYAGSFSHEWTVHRTTQLDSDSRRTSEIAFGAKTGWTPEDVRGKRVLDVGCGMGRFADVVLRWGGEVVAVDLSFAVDSAKRNLASSAKFHAAQASVFELPFRPESFDLIYSLGVLHHTPDCERAFKCLPRLLRPGGEIAIWLYSSHALPPESIDERRDRLYRRLTSRLSPRTLHALCRVLCRLPMRHRAFWHMLLPGFVFHAIPKLNHDVPEYEWRVLDTFDWYSPAYQSKHSYPEVCRWFREAGLIDIVPLDVEVAVRGRKPPRRPGAEWAKGTSGRQAVSCIV